MDARSIINELFAMEKKSFPYVDSPVVVMNDEYLPISRHQELSISITQHPVL